MMPSSMAPITVPGQAAESAEHADREHAADIFAADRGLDRLDDDQQRAGDRRGRDRDRERDALDLDRIGGHQLQRQLILRHRHDRAAKEGLGQEELQRADHKERNDAGHEHAQRNGEIAKAQGAIDVVRLHVTVIDAEHENEQHLGDEEQAEEESEAAQRFLSALLERHVIDLIDGGAERVEGRQHQDRGQDRIDAEALVHDIGDVGAEDDEGRMRDVDDVENAERDRDADRDGGIESAEQNAGDQRIDQEVAAHARPVRERVGEAMGEKSEFERRATRHAGGIVHPPRISTP